VQISETETPLHRLETVYRRLIERLSTADTQQGALRFVLERWALRWRRMCSRPGEVREDDAEALEAGVNVLMEARLSEVSLKAPAFATAAPADITRAGSGRAKTTLGGAPSDYLAHAEGMRCSRLHTDRRGAHTATAGRTLPAGAQQASGTPLR